MPRPSVNGIERQFLLVGYTPTGRSKISKCRACDKTVT